MAIVRGQEFLSLLSGDRWVAEESEEEGEEGESGRFYDGDDNDKIDDDNTDNNDDNHANADDTKPVSSVKHLVVCKSPCCLQSSLAIHTGAQALEMKIIIIIVIIILV